MLDLKRGDSILVDFDGIVCENKYPKFGNLNLDTVNFLDECKEKGVKVYIWSARCNNCLEPEDGITQFGSESVRDLKSFLITHNIYFEDIFFLPKPIGSQKNGFKYLLDDCVTNNYKEFNFK